MSVMLFPSAGLPPLPPGWTEHVGPAGQIYYYNARTRESTYIRPLLPVPLMASQASQVSKKTKEKPLVKIPIPGTDWLRVTTTQGNVFYSHKVEKRSVWTVPDEIEEAVELFEKKEKETAGDKEQVQSRIPDKRAVEEYAEIERIKSEVQELVKRKATDASPEETAPKKAKVEDGGRDGSDHGQGESGSEDESEEEDWQKEAAEQLAAEAEQQKQKLAEEVERLKSEKEVEERLKEKQLNMPNRVDLSIDEAKALFKTLLREKDINPLHPWDTSLPLFVSDPRYVLLPSVSARKEAFDEYCRERARELRQSNVKKEVASPLEAFERLLQEEVKSTRTSWTDFRRSWKKDRRFWGWGRDDREREKKFRHYIKDLGEKKRLAAQKAEEDFFALLRENDHVGPDTVWKDVKRELAHDPRYESVGSSSLREELFQSFLKAPSKAASSLNNESVNKPSPLPLLDEEQVSKDSEHQLRKERAVRERQEQVRAERNRLEADIGRSRMGLNKEESELDFRTMLVDAIRDPLMTWDQALPQLKKDPRLTHSVLPVNQQLHLFHSHVAELRSRQQKSLHALFNSHTPSLATSFTDLPLSSLMTSLPAKKLGLDEEDLRHEFDVWQRDRSAEAKKAFDEMLTENSFVEFWGRLRQIGGEGVNGGVAAEDMPEGEGEGGGGTVDMKALAKNVDVHEMEKVLKSDKRYIVFDHVPDQRERWIRTYLSQLPAPKLSVHVAGSAS